MAYEDKYKWFEQYLTSGEPGVVERAIGPWPSACRMSTDLSRQNFCLNKPSFFFETSHSHKQPKLNIYS